MTYFRSKGLQWHTVILTTCNDGLIPHQRAVVEEERRLFYVAMTRASSNLVISYVQSVCSCKVQPSRFLYEAGLRERPEIGPPEKNGAGRCCQGTRRLANRLCRNCEVKGIPST